MSNPSCPESRPGSAHPGFRFQPAHFAKLARLNAWLSAPSKGGRAGRRARGGEDSAPAPGGGIVEPRFRRPSGLGGRIHPAQRPVRGGREAAGDPGTLFGDSWEPLGDSGETLGRAGGDGAGVQRVGLGYHADLPDIRDHSSRGQLQPFLASPERLDRLARTAARRPASPAAATGTDGFLHLSQFGELPAVEHQGQMQSCTAHAVIGMAELLILRYTSVPLDLSRLFLYKCTRRLLGWTGDTGAFVRSTIKALRLFGSLPERQWPYDPARLDDEPDAFTYAYAHSFRGLEYARLDDYGATPEATLAAIKQTLEAGHPAAFGFPVFSSIADIGTDYVIPIPRDGDGREGGHAVVAVGYNDHVDVLGADGTKIDQGALIIRNSWGPEWGDQGYAYLPYWYVRMQMAVDFWTLYGLDWLDELAFELPGATPTRGR